MSGCNVCNDPDPSYPFRRCNCFLNNKEEKVMTQCPKQFDPLKKCRKRDGTEVDYLNIFYGEEKPLAAYNHKNNDQYLGHHYPCGHYWRHHRDIPDDLINVEEESENISPLEKERLRKVSESCTKATFSLMQELAKLKEVLSDLPH